MNKGLTFLRDAISGSPAPAAPTDVSATRKRGPQPVDGTPGRARAVVDAVLPVVDGGRFAVKRIAGEPIEIEAHVFTDGHDVPRVMLQWWKEGSSTRQEIPMKLRYNDEWLASFVAPAPGRYAYTVVAWVDAFESWHHELERRVDPEDIRIAARVGAHEIEAAAKRAGDGADARMLSAWAQALEEGAADPEIDADVLKALALDEQRSDAARRHPDRSLEVSFSADLPLTVERKRARFSAWYELFPRSAGDTPGRHGTLRDVAARLPLIASMGFDIVYLPPIHPIGRVQRKGRNNALGAQPGDVGSPWAIGAEEGGHKSILPELGTAEDFRALVASAAANGLELAMDIAFQCAPDHPYVRDHPEWFRWRPDGTVQYAENPPKKYQDIYPFNFESDDWQGLWTELKSVLDHWIAEGVHVFRVDNPHTKSFAFWEWVVGEVKREHPDVIFLAEAFTRPKVMHRLAKLGYTQSYTYFTWRNTKQELTRYFTELTEAPGVDYFRPNVWPNTPDILHEALQGGHAAVFKSRLVLAATLAATYGIYGPAYELLEHLPRGPSSEEYLDSEKYQLRNWDWSPDAGLRPLITRINEIRREHPALQANRSLRFLDVENDQLIAYMKQSADGRDTIVTVVNLDPHNAQWGWVALDPHLLDIEPQEPFQMHDLLTDQRFIWRGSHHYVRLDPNLPAHVMALRRRVRDERDFDYYL
ncbi:alpha-1,4-glucan--maltose-1-phosphate maltosyltransferase [Variovorax dokdonensis]|uniref:Alpha-1,4-glucan:maltose-1-phosphate maltosyltransferase n=1 Tax=Variovorax dokdonensis TaxID=344883 RepID=A0ABT7N5Y2_9BURK|nr:alpha-1,4-glucan--maltose-1-phosphate maltosyltransferase [Variovorax dokdonensis]MDM0043361.1 alpha-1,4-glucan--maltose-1-phosphate maltosyltransferase [Variovorax dokdonensis]